VATRRRATFAEIAAQARTEPPRPYRGPVGRDRRGTWIDPLGREYAKVADDLEPADAKALAAHGATVVYDRCGCGGSECELDWLSDTETQELATHQPVIRHLGKDALARLAEWRTADGHALLEIAGDVSWANLIPDRPGT
jgi:hypothetical protein